MLKTFASGNQKYAELNIPIDLLDKLYVEYDYVDIHPQILNGALSGSVYFYTHNPGQRCVFSVAQKKKAIQQQLADNQYIFQKKVYNLIFGDRQVIRTLQSDYLRLSKYPSGQFLTVMLSLSGGQDQEDSIVFKESTAQKLYLQQFEDIWEADVSRQASELEQHFMKMPKSQRNDKYNYDKIDDNGMIKPGTIVYKNDVVIGKVEQYISQLNHIQQFNDLSVVFDKPVGIVVQCIKSTSKDSTNKITVKIKQFVNVNVGDKFAVFSGGCKSTVSEIIPDSFMPCFEDEKGNLTSPDIILNIHSLATRRSMGILFEGLISQLAVNNVELIDGTPFTNGKLLIEQTQERLRELGMDDLMLQNRYDPQLMEVTGKVFRANLYFQAQDQKPVDKIYAVDYQLGARSLFTRHIVSGKKNKGAVKLLGDLEKSALLASNCPFIPQELMQKHCDGDILYICSECNQQSEKDIQANTYYCKQCNGFTQYPIHISYANIQIMRILKAMGINLSFYPEYTVSQQLILSQQINRKEIQQQKI